MTAAGESRGTVDGAVGKACHAGRSVCPPGPAHLHFGQLTSMVVPRVMMALVVAAQPKFSIAMRLAPSGKQEGLF